nr:hypothetical protein [Tanacetum cinerariifolium]
MSYLTDYEAIDGGYVAFGGNPKGGKIIGKCTIKTGSGPDWLFDIDALIRTMNYEPIAAGTQSNDYVDLMMMDSNLQVIMERSSTMNDAGTNEDNELPFDLNMPALDDVSTFNFSSDDEDDGAMADMNNLDTTI